PVCNEEDNIIGLLDITKVFHEALDKVKHYSSVLENLYSALAGVQSKPDPGASNPLTVDILAFVNALHEKAPLPDLSMVMDFHAQTVVILLMTTVHDIVKLTEECHLTACTSQDHGHFMSKDVVLQVIAAGLDGIFAVLTR
ncbi:hypothetical protein EDC04DRAFT_2588209, partial [Pisolithus marmoratus]